MKTILIVLTLLGALVLTGQIRNEVLCNYNYEKNYTQLWHLADKSSTIPAKKEYITKFVDALKAGKEKGEFSDYNALYLKTANNSFDSNLKAVETLSHRLAEIQGMNPSSFEYNTAIQQITAQEQGEAKAMLDVFEGCYKLNNYFSVWNWVGGIITGISVALLFFCGVFLILEFANNRW